MSTNRGQSKVGYGRPPEHSRFKLGRSGNPRGRPIKEKPKSGEIDVAGVLNEKIPTRDTDGAITEMSAFEGSVRKLIFWALTEGKLPHALEFLRLYKKYNAVATSSNQPFTGVVILPECYWRGEYEPAPLAEESGEKSEKRRERRKPRPRPETRPEIMRELCLELYPTKENGKRKWRRGIDLILQVVRTYAMKGNIKAIRMMDNLLEHYDKS